MCIILLLKKKKKSKPEIILVFIYGDKLIQIYVNNYLDLVPLSLKLCILLETKGFITLHHTKKMHATLETSLRYL